MKSLQDIVREPFGTKSAIRQALMSPAGLRVAWVVVEAEEDVAVYEKFMRRDTTIVKTSEDSSGRKGYANVEVIVHEVKEEEPRAHIMGIRDADYSRYEKGYTVPVNIFLTDRRDLEMMLLEAGSVRRALKSWIPEFEDVLGRCIPICRLFGYLRIYNEVNNLEVRFHDLLKTSLFWDYNIHALVDGWEKHSIEVFVSHMGDGCTYDDVIAFIETKRLGQENFYDVCRGHDVLRLLSLILIQEHIYSANNLMSKMIASYSLEDFKATQLYASIQAWQVKEGVEALAA